VLRFYRSGEGWAQELYATPPWPLSPEGPPPLPNDAVFDAEGNLYISDSLQGVVWRVAPGGGDPEVWLADDRLKPGVPGQLGVNGLRPDPSRTWLYMAVSVGVGGSGTILRAEFPDPADPGSPSPILDDLFSYTYAPGQVPDGLAFTNGGLLYVVLAGANALSVLDVVQGSELYQLDGPDGSAIQFTQPANLVFDASTALVTNHAVFAPNPSGLFAVLAMEVAHLGDPLPTPIVP
jgi:sugar lactone lactonase YvrE